MSNQTQQSVRSGPSRDMFGGPWLGVLVFILIAIGLGWGLTQIFQSMVGHTQELTANSEFNHGFDPDTTYTIKQDLVLGYLADGRVVLLPGRDELPKGTPGRRMAVSVQELRDNPADHPEHIGVAEAGTQVQFVEVIDDRENQQTRTLVMTRLLTGPYARRAPVLGMHLESVDTESEQRRVVPRADLFEPAELEIGQVQSPVPDATPSDE